MTNHAVLDSGDAIRMTPYPQHSMSMKAPQKGSHDFCFQQQRLRTQGATPEFMGLLIRFGPVSWLVDGYLSMILPKLAM